MTTEKKDCPHTPGKDGKCTKCGKRIIISHKGGRSERFYGRATPETKIMIEQITKQVGVSLSDLVEKWVKKEFKKLKNS